MRIRLREVGLRVRWPYFGLILGKQDLRARVGWNWTLRKWWRIWFSDLCTEMAICVFTSVFMSEKWTFCKQLCCRSWRIWWGGGGCYDVSRYFQRTLLVLVPVSLTAQRYMYCDEILQSNLLPVINTQIEVFQHTARATVAYILPDHNVTVLLWTSKSPDLNPMDHLWDRFDKRVCMHQTVSKLFCKLSRHYKKNCKEHPMSKLNV